MLRPSRPMMRPFMSSAESWTTETVVSAAWPAAIRCMTTERMLRTRRSASRLVSSSIWRTLRAHSWRIWSSSSRSRICLACDALRPATRSSSRTWRSRMSPISACCCSNVSSRVVSAARCWSSAASLVIRRSSSRTISVRRSFRSMSVPVPLAGRSAVVAARAPFPSVRELASAGARRASSEAPATSPAASTTAAITISMLGSSALSVCSGCARPGSRHRAREPCSEATLWPPCQMAARCVLVEGMRRGAGASGLIVRPSRDSA